MGGRGAAMAVVVLLGNLVPFTETTIPKSSFPPVDHLRSGSKSRLCPLQDSALTWSRRETCTATAPSASASTSGVTAPATFLASISTGSTTRSCCGCSLGAAASGGWCGARGSRAGAANFASGGVGGGGESDDEDEGEMDWEEQLRSRLKELEDMKELERRAEELRSRMMAEEEGGENGETEEEKRERVRKELEKVMLAYLPPPTPNPRRRNRHHWNQLSIWEEFLTLMPLCFAVSRRVRAAGEGAGGAAGNGQADVRAGAEGLREGHVREGHRVLGGGPHHHSKADTSWRGGEGLLPVVLLALSSYWSFLGYLLASVGIKSLTCCVLRL